MAEQATATAPDRPVSQVLRVVVLLPLAVAAGCTGLTLTLLSGSTDAYFAWQTSAVTAALLGAAYSGACIMLALAVRAEHWARVRVATAATAVLMLLMLGACLLGRGATHLAGGPIVAFFAAWIWLGIHLAAPLLGLIALGAQWRVRGPAPVRVPRLPWWVVGPMAVNGLALTAAGLVLYVRADPLAADWPWTAGPLDVRALGAWCLTFGLALLLAIREAELRRVRSGMAALVTTGVLGLLGLIRYGDQVAWSSLGAWLVLLVLLALPGLGLAGYGISWMLDPSEPVTEPGGPTVVDSPLVEPGAMAVVATPLPGPTAGPAAGPTSGSAGGPIPGVAAVPTPPPAGVRTGGVRANADAPASAPGGAPTDAQS